MPRIRLFSRLATILIGASLLVAAVLTVAVPGVANAAETCLQYGNEAVNGGRYLVQNNHWNVDGPDADKAPQCINARDGGFTVSSANGSVRTDGPPKSYPSIFAGCHYTACSAGSGLPIRASDVGTARTGVRIGTTGGQWDAAYDIWFDSGPNPTAQNNGTEIMIWINHLGRPQPIGSPTGQVTIGGATYTVWQGVGHGTVDWNVISFVDNNPATSITASIKDFVDESIRRGATRPEWYMTSVQFGFEPWEGGTGLSADGFFFERGTAAGGPTEPPASGAGQVVGVGSNKCLTSQGTANFSRVVINDCTGSAAQKWDVSNNRIKQVGTNACLSVEANSTADNAGIWMYDCQNTTGQQFVRDGQFLRNTVSNKCLDVYERATANGSRLTQWGCNTNAANNSNQLWRVS